MEMADYLGDKGVPVALVAPFDGTQSFPVPGNVARVINFTQRDYAYMRPGPGFHGSLSNVDLSYDHDIDHLNIDKSPLLHARVIDEVLAVIGGRSVAPAKPKGTFSNKDQLPTSVDGRAESVHEGRAKIDETPTGLNLPVRPHDGASRTTDTVKLLPDAGIPTIVLPESNPRPTSPHSDASSPCPTASSSGRPSRSGSNSRLSLRVSCVTDNSLSPPIIPSGLSAMTSTWPSSTSGQSCWYRAVRL